MTLPVDPEAYFGADRPAGVALADARGGVGRLTPLSLKYDGAYSGVPLGFVQTNAGQALASLPAPIPADAHSATIQVQGGAIRYTFDGTPPTAAIGHRADPGAILQLTMSETLRGFQWISEAAVNNTLAVTYWS